MRPGKGLRDQLGAAYARAGLERIVVMTVPTFTAAVAIVESTELVATVPESLLEVHPKLHRLNGPMPAHSVEISMNWHDRTEADPAARALRGIVRAALA
jgi:DNA-binding transcriptional LysR family regulator